jgi:hypothetical protein
MDGELPMMRETQNMLTIKQLVQDDRYRVDPYVVADAILRRAMMREGAWMPGPSQIECSKPASSSSASTNTRPGGPSTTDPMGVRRALGGAS